MPRLSFGFKHFKAPTPKVLKRLGSAMWAMSTSVAVPAALNDKMWIGISLFAIGGVGKFLCEFCTIEDDKNDNK
jgi:hypothetical protein